MWRRWNNSDHYMNQTSLNESNLDDGYLETIPEVESLRSKRSSVAANLPDLTFRNAPSYLEDTGLTTNRRVSSIYSQPSPQFPQDEFVNESSYQHSRDVSPLSSPRSSIHNAASDTSVVSPIESSFTLPAEISKPEPKPKSQIPRPVALNTQSGKQDTSKTSARKLHEDTEKTKWDEYSGEPTTNDSGKPSAVRPGAEPLEVQFPQLKERTKQILAGLRERDATKNTAWGRPPPPVATDPLDNPVHKEPWKGASGRTTLVEPVKNTPAARTGPLQFPQRNLSRVNLEQQKQSHSPDGVAPPSIRAISPDTIDDAHLKTVSSQESIRPIVPLKIVNQRTISPTKTPNLNTSQDSIQNPQSPTSTTPRQTHPYDQVRREKSANNPLDFMSIPYEHTNKNTLQPRFVERIDTEHGSRMSWTTYTSTVTESPRVEKGLWDETPDPHFNDDLGTTPVLKRPVSVTPYASSPPHDERRMSNASIFSRKPLPLDKSRKSSVMTTASATKSLPPTPNEIQAGDKITSLEARLEDLERRKRNNHKIITELEVNLKKNAILYDSSKRKEIEKNMTNLRLEIDEITQEEHDVGLLLHRAHRKKAKQDNYEQPTGLWIKRVTS